MHLSEAVLNREIRVMVEELVPASVFSVRDTSTHYVHGVALSLNKCIGPWNGGLQHFSRSDCILDHSNYIYVSMGLQKTSSESD